MKGCLDRVRGYGRLASGMIITVVVAELLFFSDAQEGPRGVQLLEEGSNFSLVKM